tara:strand:+ start:1976 stop:2206 length:231 start_codon:yes stop_codon:yes gene_type:complete
LVARSWRQVSSCDIPVSAIAAVFSLVAGGSLVNMVPGNLAARKSQSKWVPPQILRALVQHPASKPLGVYYPAAFRR